MRFSIILSFVVIFLAQSSPPDTVWTRTIGGAGDERGYYIKETNDKGFIIAGSRDSDNDSTFRAYIVKVDSTGILQWSKEYGKALRTEAYDLEITVDSGYILCGYSFEYSNNRIYVLKTDIDGDSLWCREYFIEPPYNVKGRDIECISGDGYVVVGTCKKYAMTPHSQVFLLKIDSVGDTLWTREFGSMYEDEGNGVTVTSNGNYALCGYYDNWYHMDFYFLEVGESGNLIRERNYNNEFSGKAYDIIQDYDGGYIMAGMGGAYNLLKTDSLGDSLWAHRYISGYENKIKCIKQPADSGYIMTGNFNDDIYIARTNTEGDTIWTKTFGGAGIERAHSVDITSGGQYIIVGSTNSYGAGGDDIYLIKIESDTGIHDISEDDGKNEIKRQQTNIFYDEVEISYYLKRNSDVDISVFDVTGKEIIKMENIPSEKGMNRVCLDKNILTTGLYLLKMESKEINQVFKFIKIK